MKTAVKSARIIRKLKSCPTIAVAEPRGTQGQRRKKKKKWERPSYGRSAGPMVKLTEKVVSVMFIVFSARLKFIEYVTFDVFIARLKKFFGAETEFRRAPSRTGQASMMIDQGGTDLETHGKKLMGITLIDFNGTPSPEPETTQETESEIFKKNSHEKGFYIAR